MNVLYLTNSPYRLSTTVPTEGWFRILPERGLRPVLVSRELGAFHEWAVENNIPSYKDALPFPNKWSPIPFLQSLWHLRKIVLKHRIELIHCNEQDCYPMGSYIARLMGLPVVVSVHFSMDRGFSTWAFGGKKMPDRIFFISRGNIEACRKGVTNVIPEDRWRLLYNGLDLNMFQRDERRRQTFREQYGLKESVAVGVACALRPRKQLEHLFSATARSKNKNLKVVVAGGPVKGDEEYVQSLLRQGQQLLGDRLILLGHLNELRDFYNGLDVFVNTSQEEACSISVIESLACGCPVLGYPSKSVDDQILPHGGEIVAQDSVDDLTEALDRWQGDLMQLSHRRELARRQAEDQFDIQKLAVNLWDEYTSLLNSKRAITVGAGALVS